MRKSSGLLTSLLLPLAVAAFAAQSCSGGESAPSGTGATSGTGAATGSGGRQGSSGGSGSFGSGGSSSFGSGGAGPSGSSGGSSSSGSGGAGTGTGSGGSSFGTGGSASGTGGAPIIGGGTGGAPTLGALTITGGYATNGTWKGYAYTFTGPAAGTTATVAPASFMTATQLCTTGMIAPDPTFNSVAGFGWSVAQDLPTTAVPTPVGTVATTGAGLLIDVSPVMGLTLATGGGSQLRVQIQNATASWCAPIAAAGKSMIPWGSFNTMCWDTAKVGAVAYTVGTPITAVGLVVPSAAAAIGPFSFCLLDAHPY